MFGPQYIYRVLDIWRDRKQFVSLQDIKSFLSPPEEERRKQRAGLVRGHFKIRQTGLFWWDMFMRNSRNAQTVGVIDKDYSLKL